MLGTLVLAAAIAAPMTPQSLRTAAHDSYEWQILLNDPSDLEKATGLVLH